MLPAGFIWLRVQKMTGCFEHGNEQSCTIKCEEFIDQLIGLPLKTLLDDSRQ
jgi:hypothetical protein